jgi:hypothetical protein
MVIQKISESAETGSLRSQLKKSSCDIKMKKLSIANCQLSIVNETS